MTRTGGALTYAATILIGGGLVAAAWMMYLFWGGVKLEYAPFHAAVEALGALSAILTAGILLERSSARLGGRVFLLAVAFLVMGILDGFHAVTIPGHGFVLLHSTAVLAGGFWFALVWLPPVVSDPGPDVSWKRWLPWAIAGAAVVFAVWAIAARQMFPAMVVGGRFTPEAITLNVAGGLLFLAAAARLLLDFRASGETEMYLFACMAVLFGLAGITFTLSSMWSPSWWLWHLLRLAAYALALGFVTAAYSRAVRELRIALREKEEAQERTLRVNRLYAVLSEINEAIVRIHEKQELLQEVCRIVVEYGRFKLAWIGLVEERGREVKPCAHSGGEDGYLGGVRFSLSDDLRAGPVESALRHGERFVCDHGLAATCRVPWHAEAAGHGYVSCAYFPIKLRDRVVGALGVCASECGLFDEEGLRLLDEVAVDISYALETMAEETRRSEAEQGLAQALKDLEVERQRMEELARNVIDSQEQERMYLASEIHDELLQGMVPQPTSWMHSTCPRCRGRRSSESSAWRRYCAHPSAKAGHC